ncbi:MAG: DUF1348 family protein [Proteobacteria bacterium]|nr:MAG: DUF1348 family protein [Pseudomonadota bacterium]
MHRPGETRPPLSPFTRETAVHRVRLAEDAWIPRDPQRFVSSDVLSQRVLVPHTVSS